MRDDCDILIVGGGLNGPALALALASAGISSIVLDARPRAEHESADFDGRAYALSLSSRRMLEVLGIWSRVEARAQQIEAIKISDGRPGEGASSLHLHFQSAEIDEGAMGHILEDRFLRAALLEAMDEAPWVEARSGVRVVRQHVEAGRVRVELEDGTQLSAALLAGCDGRGSEVARRSGIGRVGWDYRQSSLVCAIEHERPHCGTAHQFFMPAGPLAILPLPGNRSSIVWTEERSQAEAISRLFPQEYLRVLEPRFGDFLGRISLAGGRYSYPLGLTVAERFVGSRVALVGDAAHGIHPLAGQGLNLGLRDVAALAEVLSESFRCGLDLGAPDVLESYQRWRRFDTALLAGATDGINRLFSNDNPVLRLGRDLGLAAVNRLPRLRRGFIREAAGLSGDLPRLLQGRAL
ncbi:FAD-dependent monooxygenase [Amaricoccus macauensis]|uniref:FAD-dependent monooxygenase n=1 Tax=Amaricoccus macauensis TaxID=57001 RepID=UPI003C7C1D24